ncbi:unnamed protein product, partial [Didymodactylos carnosus]
SSFEMGKNKDKKKKGAGVQKTTTKTKKKVEKELKKQIEQLGEENVEQLISKHIQNDEKIAVITEEPVDIPPSRRANGSFSEHPLKDELILFGGEFFDGKITTMYNDLYLYDIKKQQWKHVISPQPPAPRSGHQAVTVALREGELWLFGGEYTSPSQSQFYHYSDLFVLHLSTLRWEKMTSPNPPSARS